jgi:hypothetical protein
MSCRRRSSTPGSPVSIRQGSYPRCQARSSPAPPIAPGRFGSRGSMAVLACAHLAAPPGGPNRATRSGSGRASWRWPRGVPHTLAEPEPRSRSPTDRPHPGVERFDAWPPSVLKRIRRSGRFSRFQRSPRSIRRLIRNRSRERPEIRSPWRATRLTTRFRSRERRRRRRGAEQTPAAGRNQRVAGPQSARRIGAEFAERRTDACRSIHAAQVAASRVEIHPSDCSLSFSWRCRSPCPPKALSSSSSGCACTTPSGSTPSSISWMTPGR